MSCQIMITSRTQNSRRFNVITPKFIILVNEQYFWTTSSEIIQLFLSCDIDTHDLNMGLFTISTKVWIKSYSAATVVFCTQNSFLYNHWGSWVLWLCNVYVPAWIKWRPPALKNEATQEAPQANALRKSTRLWRWLYIVAKLCNYNVTWCTGAQTSLLLWAKIVKEASWFLWASSLFYRQKSPFHTLHYA